MRGEVLDSLNSEGIRKFEEAISAKIMHFN